MEKAPRAEAAHQRNELTNHTMRFALGFLFATVFFLGAVVAWLLWPKPITTQELAAAMDAHYWRYRVPDTITAHNFIDPEVTTPDGARQKGGGGGGFEPGEMLTIVVIPSDDGSKLRWTLIGPDSRHHTVIDNPFHGLSMTAYQPSGTLLDDNILIVGGEGQISVRQPKPSDAVLRIAVQE